MYKKCVLAIALASSSLAMCQDAPVVKKPKIDKIDFALVAADGMLRIGDTITSQNLFGNPCKCFHEVDPIAPSHGWAQISLFQAGAFLAVDYGHHLLIKHHHTRWAKTLVALDVIDESLAVGHNAYLWHNAPAPHPTAR